MEINKDKIKTAIAIILIAGSGFSLRAWEATPHMNDGFHLMEWEEEQKYINEYPEHLRDYVAKISREYLVPIKYLYRLHYIESKLGRYNIRHETNNTKSIGFGQLNTASLEYFQRRYNNGRWFDPYDEKDNIRISAMYFRDLYERTDGNWIDSGIAYNWGIGNVRSGKEIPIQCVEYGFAIVWGVDYTDCVVYLTGAVRGML